MNLFSEYYAPATIEECLAAKRQAGGGARFLAGGTDLVPKLRGGRLQADAVVDLAHVAGLDALAWREGRLHLGAMLRLSALAKRATDLGAYGVVARAAGHVSSIQVRNMATLGGNSCNASPSADTVPALLVCGASARLVGGESERLVPLLDFFAGPGQTCLGPDELLAGFVLPAPPARCGADYQKFAIRGDSDIAIAGAAALLALDDTGAIADARIAMGAVGPTPLRAPGAEALLLGRRPGAGLFAQAADAAAQEASPIGDQRAGRAYRLDMLRVTVRHALHNSAEAAASA